MINKDLLKIITKIEEITGALEYDEKDFEDQAEINEEYSLWIDYYEGTGIEIDVTLSRISLFRSFGYSDFPKSTIDKGCFDTEELEWEIHTWLLEKSFTLYLKSHSIDFPVSTWDDGVYMCPGYTSRVGFRELPFSDELISEFVRLAKSYHCEMDNLHDNELRRYIVKKICQDHGIFTAPGDCIPLGHSSSLYLKHITFECEESVTSYYIGKEKFLFQAHGKNYATDITPVQVFLDAFDSCEMYDNIGISFSQDSLKLSSKNMTLCMIPTEDPHGLYAQVEEMTTVICSSSFLPFASEKFKETFASNFPEYAAHTPLIITEGSTDWKHLKKHWRLLKYEFPGLDLAFYEYEPPNAKSADRTYQEMGSSNLYEMCRAYSRNPLGRIFIFIADRDEPTIVSKMGGIQDEYKDWGNHVYSFVLPVPPHRIGTPNICIEHYYTDNELKTKHLCPDGIARSLYLGNDFDHFGRNIAEELLCTKRNLCGENSIKVIDGSSDCRVISSSNSDETNYALSKSDFAEYITPNKNSPSYEAFRKLFP